MSPSKTPKLFVLDTNVILHDSACLGHFKQHDIVLPITVLEELDHFKKGNDSINYHAREFLRELDAISGDQLFADGIDLGEDKGRVRLVLEAEFAPELAGNFSISNPDHRILNCAFKLAARESDRETVLVSKDVNLRMKAKAIGLCAQDYTSDHVKDPALLYTGSRLVEEVPGSLIDRLYEEGGFEPKALDLERPPLANESFILRNHSKSGLAVFDEAEDRLRRVSKTQAFGITPRNAEQALALNILTNPDIPLVSVTGTAGTGKTLLALAAALQQTKRYRQIFLARPVVPLSNKDIGYLPGEINAKLAPYMQPIYDNLEVLKQQHTGNGPPNQRSQLIKRMLDEEKLKISALSYIRGRSLNNIFFIVDEAQNLTPHEVKTIVTRAGEGTKIVFTGDIFQIDHPYLDSQSNGLSTLIERMQGQSLYAHINLQKGERSELAGLASQLL